VVYLYSMSKINEIGDLGDRMMQGLPYGQGGAIAGASSPGVYDTFKSKTVTQNPSKFDTFTDKSKLTAKDTEKQITPYSQDSSWNYVKSVEQIKDKVTPDEVLMGIDYEMKKLVLKDKSVAKQIVVQNLKKDPKYYSKLHMMGIEPDEKNEAIMEVMTSLKARKYALKNGDFYS
jgi:hypothetical protein